MQLLNDIFYNTTFTTFSSAGFTNYTLYITKDFNILDNDLDVKNENQDSIHLTSSVNEFGNILDVKKEFQSEIFYEMAIQVKPEVLKDRTLVSYIYNKELQNPDFLTNVKNKNKAFYKGNEKLESILEYILVNIWDRTESDYIYSHFIKDSLIEGKLEGKGEVLLPYGDSDIIDSFNDKVVFRVSVYMIKHANKNSFSKINLFFLKDGFNPVYYTNEIKFTAEKENSTSEIIKAEQIWVDSYVLVKKGLKNIIQQSQ